MNQVTAVNTHGAGGTIDWLTDQIFDEAGWKHRFAHQIELFTAALPRDRGSYSSQLAKISVGPMPIEDLVPIHFQHVYGFGTWFYGGWIDGAVFQIESVRRGQSERNREAFREFSMLLDSQPIEQAGDGFWGFTDDRHEMSLFVETEQSADRLYLHGRLLTDSGSAYQRSLELIPPTAEPQARPGGSKAEDQP